MGKLEGQLAQVNCRGADKVTFRVKIREVITPI
jgi:hypothetical protein